MEALTCQTHNRETCVVDLDLSILICQKCALFDPQYKHHQFLDSESLPAHALKLHQQYQQAIQSLKISTDKNSTPQWKTLEIIARQALDTKVKDINIMYDEMIAEIERERTQMITNIAQVVSSLVRNSSEEVNQLVKDNYLQLLRKNQSYGQFVKEQKYLQLSKQLTHNDYKEIIRVIEHDLSMIQLDLKNKLRHVDSSPQPQMNLIRRRTSVKDELLLACESIQPLQQLKHDQVKERPFCKTDRFPMKEVFKTEASPLPETEKCSTIYSKQLDMSCSQIQVNSKTTKVITKQSEIKNINIKNTIKKVILASLNLGNREAIDALKRCTTGTFVTTVDLSQNQLTSEFIVLMKRQKNHSKYLKKIIIKGMQMTNPPSPKKEGFSLDMMKEGKAKIGNILLQL